MPMDPPLMPMDPPFMPMNPPVGTVYWTLLYSTVLYKYLTFIIP